MMFIKCVTACRNANGEPDFTHCIVACTTDENTEGLHYEGAEVRAVHNGYDVPMITFDENDGPVWLFERFDWDNCEQVNCEGES